MKSMKKKRTKQSLFAHLDELRRRLIVCGVTVGITTVISIIYVDRLRWILVRPAETLELVFLYPAEALMANMRLGFMSGIVLAMPVILYQCLLFVLPALYKKERKTIILAVCIMVLFFALGVSFSYFTVFPITIHFFMKFASDTLKPMFTISNYISFATNFNFAFGVVFQTPIIFYVLGHFRVVSPSFLQKQRKYAYLLVFIIAALLTPPDVVSQIMMAGPLILLFELGVILVIFSQKKGKYKLSKKISRVFNRVRNPFKKKVP